MTHRGRDASIDAGPAELPTRIDGATSGDGVGRLLLVEDDDSLRLLYSKALRMLGFVVDEERTLFEALSRLEKAPFYDCLVVDLGLPDGDGADLVRFAHGGHAPCAVIALSEERLTARRVLEVGEHALVLPKPLRIEELVEAIGRRRPARKPAGGESSFANRFGLTKTERRILRNLREGDDSTRAERARRLGCQPTTYAKHLQNIFTKTNCHSTEELGAMLAQHEERERSI